MAIKDPATPSTPETEVERLRRELGEALEREAASLAREAATADILRTLAGTPADLQSVLDALVENAARLCEASGAQIFRLDDDGLRRVAGFGTYVLPIGE